MTQRWFGGVYSWENITISSSFCRETELEKELSELKAQLASFEFGKIESDRQNLDILDQLKAENETIKGGKISEGLFNLAPSQKNLLTLKVST